MDRTKKLYNYQQAKPKEHHKQGFFENCKKVLRTDDRDGNAWKTNYKALK